MALIRFILFVMILTSFRIVSSFQKGLPTARLSNAWRMSHTMTHSAIGSLNTHRNPFYPSKNAYSNAHSKFMSSKKLRMSAVDTLASTQAGSKVAYDLNAVRAILNNGDSFNNVPESVVDKVGSNLHLQMNHPLNIIKKRIESFCQNYAKENKYSSEFTIHDNLSPIVDTKNCFDYLRVDENHVSRRPSDTYYVSKEKLLRTHTSAHQVQFISNGVPAFLCTGDVYRRDEIDSSHYPVFHQMEGVRIFQDTDFPATAVTAADKKKIIEEDLKTLLTGLAKYLFGDVEIRWREDYFPFTEPSFELDVFFNGDWMEVLGCGVIHNDVMNNAGKGDQVGWAFGMGLERLAMVLFDIPDIRLFWSKDERFISQFKDGSITKFQPYSKFPLCYKDVSFWLPKVEEGSGETEVHVNDIYEVIRNIGGDLIEKVELFDEYTNHKTGKKSQAYRVIYRSMDRSLTNEEVDVIQDKIRRALEEKLRVTLR